MSLTQVIAGHHGLPATRSEKLIRLMRQRALCDLALAKKLAVAHTTVGRWRRGAKPRGRVALKLAQYFHVPVETLLGDERPLPALIEATRKNNAS